MVKKILILSSLFFSVSSMVLFEVTTSETSVENEPTTYKPIVVLELFTSQGCSSCPPADALLEKAKNTYPDQVYALSYHVDYWNYIGWEDPFSHPNYAKKQAAYNRKFRYHSNYTPEMVVNGKEHFVGSNAAKLSNKIAVFGEQTPENEITLAAVNKQSNTVKFQYSLKGPLDNKTLRVVLVLDKRVTAVKRGENRNRTLTNANIVIQETFLQVEGASGKGTIQLPSGISSKETLQLMVLLENDSLDITAAEKYAL